MSVVSTRRSLLRGGAPLATDSPPPWAGTDFTDQCTRCGNCLDACPEGVLYKGDGGFPQIRFSETGCTLCGECTAVCDAPVFDPERQPFAWKPVIEEHCLAENNIHCQSCRDVCAPRAIRFKPALGHVPLPLIDWEACTGCGACVAACPQQAIALETPHDSQQAQL